MVCRNHPVNIHMEFAGTRVVILGQDEADIDSGFFELPEDIVVSLVSACPVVTEKDDAFKAFLMKPPGETIKLRPVDPVGNRVIAFKREFRTFLEAGMALGNDAVPAKSFKGKER